MKEYKLKSFDEKELHIYLWDDVKEPRAVLQLVHGSAEHAKRYDEFAKFLNKNGIIVIADDHRGHGKTANLKENELGWFAKENGWDIIIDDELFINKHIRETFPNLKIIMLGHSMGSFMARTYAIKYSETIEGLILSGTAEYGTFLMKTAKKIAAKRKRINDGKGPDEFIWNLSYKTLNKKFKNEGNTGSEWQTRDKKIQEEFMNDPLAGQHFSAGAFHDMFTGILFMQKKSNIKQISKDLPIMIVSGSDDAVSVYGKTVKRTFKKFKKAKLNVEMKIYDKSRHELVFDNDKEVVMNDALEFINKVLG